MVLCDISLLGRCWGTSRFTDVQPIFLDVDVYKWMLSSIPIEVEEVEGPLVLWFINDIHERWNCLIVLVMIVWEIIPMSVDSKKQIHALSQTQLSQKPHLCRIDPSLPSVSPYILLYFNLACVEHGYDENSAVSK